MGENGLQALPRHQLERGNAIANMRPEGSQELDGLPWTPDGHKRRSGGSGARIEPQHRRGDDAERALGAEEYLLQVVAGVVLAQAAQAVPYAAIGKHHLETEHLLARVAVAQ